MTYGNLIGLVRTWNFLCAETYCYLVHEKITRGMNQLGWAVLYLGRLAILFDWACRIERQKIGFG